MDPAADFQVPARYHSGANGRLPESCAWLDDSAYLGRLRVPFGNMHGLLNHLPPGTAYRARGTGELRRLHRPGVLQHC